MILKITLHIVARIRLINLFCFQREKIDFVDHKMTEKTKKNKIAWSDDLSHDSEEERGLKLILYLSRTIIDSLILLRFHRKRKISIS